MAAAPAADDDEYVQLQINEAFIYKCAPRGSSAGHKASEWTEQVAVVRVQVVTRGKDYAVRLLRADTGRVFASAPTRAGGPSAVEQTIDSSRYFALRIEDGKGACSVGGAPRALCSSLTSYRHLPPLSRTCRQSRLCRPRPQQARGRL